MDGCEFSYKYVLVDESNRMGYLLIWEVSSKRAINISRVKVADSKPFISINDIEKQTKEIPDDLKFEPMNSF